MANIIGILIGVVLGGLPTLYVVWKFFETITYKIYRKVKYGYSLYD